MARPQRNDVDYFPHPVTHGRKMFVIEQRFGNDGYAVWFKVLEQLGKAQYHYLDFRDESQLLYLGSLFRVDEKTLFEILDTLATLGAIHTGLWKSHKVVFSEKFTESVIDAYARRHNKCMDLPGLCKHLGVKCMQKPPRNGVNGCKNTQRKGKDRIGKDRKVKQGEFVSMTETEFKTLESEFGLPFASKCIDVLNSYKGSSGKTYKSDYMAIRAWVVDRVKKDGFKPGPAEPGKTFKVEKAI